MDRLKSDKERLLNSTIDKLADLLEEAYLVLSEQGETRLAIRIRNRLKELGRNV